ncbi:MvdC/MvdD family ATP grasp protein [Paracoccus sp. (in: a-proteobacteria)]|uniref:ATP-grasp domain-containing protein n=1 Tax=Paracoccus sp. TaxID=267 RepID=UPI0032204F99
MILIISFLDNEHVRRVTRHLTHDFEVVDLAWFPERMRMHAHAGRERDALFLDLPSGRRLDLDRVGAVWHRRIRSFTLDPGLSDDTARTFAFSECNEALPGLWPAMDCFWMNPPHADERAMKKVAQHRLARQAGLRVPETLVTNGPDEARAFIEAHAAQGVVRKAFRNIPQAPRVTLRIGPEELALIDSVRFAPVIFQEYVPLALDLRVTVVDGEIFATSFRSEAGFETDYRPGIGSAEVRPYPLPDEVAEALLRLMTRMELKFGAADFRLTPEGEHVFFEINSAGEFLFVCDRTGQPIPQAIAAALERHDS